MEFFYEQGSYWAIDNSPTEESFIPRGKKRKSDEMVITLCVLLIYLFNYYKFNIKCNCNFSNYTKVIKI